MLAPINQRIVPFRLQVESNPTNLNACSSLEGFDTPLGSKSIRDSPAMNKTRASDALHMHDVQVLGWNKMLVIKKSMLQILERNLVTPIQPHHLSFRETIELGSLQINLLHFQVMRNGTKT